MRRSVFCKNNRARRAKAFSLVELVVVVLIMGVLAVAVFAGGSASIKKAQISRVKSDLHNFSVAMESTMNETPTALNVMSNDISAGSGMLKVVQKFNENLPTDYQIADVTSPIASTAAGVTRNIRFVADTAGSGQYLIYESQKLDAWDNPYYIIFDSTNKGPESEFKVSVISAGANSQATIGGSREDDDISLVVRDIDSDIFARIYEGMVKMTARINGFHFDVEEGATWSKVVNNNSNTFGTYNGNVYIKSDAIASGNAAPSPGGKPSSNNTQKVTYHMLKMNGNYVSASSTVLDANYTIEDITVG